MGHTPWTLAETRDRVRASLRDSFPRMFGDRWHEAEKIYYDTFAANHLRRLREMPGAGAMLAGLAARGLYLAVVSNKQGRFLRLEADQLSWTGYFGRLIGAKDAAAQLVAQLEKAEGAPELYVPLSEALAMLEGERERSRPDVILCDLEMPEMDGIAFLREVAERGLARGVVIISGREPEILVGVETMVRASGLAVLGRLGKPVSPEDLWAALSAEPKADADDGAGGRRLRMRPAWHADVARPRGHHVRHVGRDRARPHGPGRSGRRRARSGADLSTVHGGAGEDRGTGRLL